MSVSNLQEHIGYWHNRLGQKIGLAFEQRLRTFDVTLSQWCVMISLYHQQVNTVSELAKLLDIDVGAVTRLVDRLSDKSLVYRVVNECDGRSSRVNLTDAGKKLVPKLALEADRNDQCFFSVLNEHELHQYKQLLTRLLTENAIAIDASWQDTPLKKPQE